MAVASPSYSMSATAARYGPGGPSPPLSAAPSPAPSRTPSPVASHSPEAHTPEQEHSPSLPLQRSLHGSPILHAQSSAPSDYAETPASAADSSYSSAPDESQSQFRPPHVTGWDNPEMLLNAGIDGHVPLWDQSSAYQDQFGLLNEPNNVRKAITCAILGHLICSIPGIRSIRCITKRFITRLGP